MQRPFELPVDIPKKSELVKARMGWLVLLSILAIISFILFLLSINLGVILAKGSGTLPDIRILENYHPNQSTRIFDRNNNLLANIHGDEDRVVVPLSSISTNIQRAVMAIEDNRFYQHNGVDIRGTFRAIATNARGGARQGGSTLTQQLVKNLFLSPERSYSRKLAEAVLSLRVEKYYSKDKILEMYLNQVYWGNRAYGIEKAGRRYFGVSAKELSISQAALLAGLLKAPEGLSPFRHPKAARKRQLNVIAKMKDYGYITDEQAEEAKAEKITFRSQIEQPSRHPYYVSHVIHELNQTYGTDAVRRGGLQVYTSIDPKAQKAAKKALTDRIKAFPNYSNVSNGALIAIDVDTAEIIAMVGGIDFKQSQFNNATQAKRAAGSQFKPFVYLTAFRLGLLTPNSIIHDKPISYNTGVSIWRPKNYDGRFLGPITIREALTRSRNTTTVQVGQRVGIDEVIKTAKLAGVTSKIDRNFASFLGASGMSPLQMATAFSTFARNGVRMYPTTIRRVENVSKEQLKYKKPKPERTLNQEAVEQLNSILVNVVENGTGRRAKLPDRQVAGKTGTTDKTRDIWFTGFTPDMVATIWMGNEKYVPLRGVYSSDAAQVWHDFAEGYYAEHDIPPRAFELPPNSGVPNKGVVVVDVAPTPKAPRLPKLDLVQPAPLKPLKPIQAPKKRAISQITQTDSIPTQIKTTPTKTTPTKSSVKQALPAPIGPEPIGPAPEPRHP